MFGTLGHCNFIENSCLPAGRKNCKLKIPSKLLFCASTTLYHRPVTMYIKVYGSKKKISKGL
jgi:hypothetical protein